MWKKKVFLSQWKTILAEEPPPPSPHHHHLLPLPAREYQMVSSLGIFLGFAFFLFYLNIYFFFFFFFFFFFWNSAHTQ